MKKLSAVLAGILAVSTVMSGCASTGTTASSTASSKGAVSETAPAAPAALSGKISLAVPEGSYATFMRDKVIPKLTEKHPDVSVDVIADSDIETMIAAGEYPNVYTGGFGARGMRYAKSGVLVPLNTFPDFDEMAARVGEEYLTTYADYNFYMPWNLTTTMMAYNIDLFNQAGLDPENPPKTVEEFLAAAKKIDDLGPDIYGTVFWNDSLASGGWYWNMIAPIYYNFNGVEYQLLNKNGTDVVFDKPEAKLKETFEFLQACQEMAPASMHSDGSVGFFRRNIGMWMQFGYGWKANFAEAEGAPMEIGKDVGIAPIPVLKEGDKNYSTLDANGLVIFKSDEMKQNISWELIKLLMDDELNLEACKALGQLPTLSSLQDDEFFKQASEQPFVVQSKTGIMPEPYAEADTVAAVVLKGIQSVTIDKSATAEEAVAKAAAEAREQLKK